MGQYLIQVLEAVRLTYHVRVENEPQEAAALLPFQLRGVKGLFDYVSAVHYGMDRICCLFLYQLSSYFGRIP
jgi:hypothetical protein